MDQQTNQVAKKILIVEDDLFLRDIYVRVFEKAGCKVVSSEDGEGALKIAEENPDASIMMLDIMIPKINGIEVLRKLKSQENTKQIPVVLLTNLGEESVLQEGFKLGAIDNILKVNLTPPEVVDHVMEMLQKAQKNTNPQIATQNQSQAPKQDSNNTTPDQQ